jgi:hypothetical protein
MPIRQERLRRAFTYSQNDTCVMSHEAEQIQVSKLTRS